MTKVGGRIERRRRWEIGRFDIGESGCTLNKSGLRP